MTINYYVMSIVLYRRKVFSWFIYIFCSSILVYNQINLPLYPVLYKCSFCILCITSFLRNFFSLFSMKNIRDLYMLPISFSSIYGNICVALAVDMLFGKYIPLVILLRSNVTVNFLVSLFIVALISLEMSFIFICKRRNLFLWLLLCVFLCIINFLGFYLVVLVACGVFVYKYNFPIELVNNKKNKISKFNYFANKLISNRYFWINSLALLIFTILLTYKLSNLGISVLISIMFALPTINSPVLTMLSIDKDTGRQIRLSPKSFIILRQYFNVIFIYFIFGNGIICFLLTITKYLNFSLYCVIGIILLSIIESIYSVWIEHQYPIKHDRQERIWKSPRKYILLILVYLIVFAVL